MSKKEKSTNEKLQNKKFAIVKQQTKKTKLGVDEISQTPVLVCTLKEDKVTINGMQFTERQYEQLQSLLLKFQSKKSQPKLINIK